MRTYVGELGQKVIELERGNDVRCEGELDALERVRRSVPLDEAFPHDLDCLRTEASDLVDGGQAGSEDTFSEVAFLTSERENVLWVSHLET